jgi:prolyl oligopeptidase PreP (S9A serine peptidase family)
MKLHRGVCVFAFAFFSRQPIKLMIILGVTKRLAVAGIRGGGEYGRAWQEAGATIKRQNAYDDFQYAARYLIQEGISAKGKIISTGSSNGTAVIVSCFTTSSKLPSRGAQAAYLWLRA